MAHRARAARQRGPTGIDSTGARPERAVTPRSRRFDQCPARGRRHHRIVCRGATGDAHRGGSRGLSSGGLSVVAVSDGHAQQIPVVTVWSRISHHGATRRTINRISFNTELASDLHVLVSIDTKRHRLTVPDSGSIPVHLRQTTDAVGRDSGTASTDIDPDEPGRARCEYGQY